jgi:hypothetical protein
VRPSVYNYEITLQNTPFGEEKAPLWMQYKNIGKKKFDAFAMNQNYSIFLI